MERQPSDQRTSRATRRKEKLFWLASLLLALLVMCSGCGFFFAVGLLSRGELDANVLGANLRLWRIVGKPSTGLGFDRAFEIRPANRSCLHHDTLIVLWKPTLSFDNLTYDDCS